MFRLRLINKLLRDFFDHVLLAEKSFHDFSTQRKGWDSRTQKQDVEPYFIKNLGTVLYHRLHNPEEVPPHVTMRTKCINDELLAVDATNGTGGMSSTARRKYEYQLCHALAIQDRNTWKALIYWEYPLLPGDIEENWGLVEPNIPAHEGLAASFVVGNKAAAEQFLAIGAHPLGPLDAIWKAEQPLSCPLLAAARYADAEVVETLMKLAKTPLETTEMVDDQITLINLPVL